MTEKRAKITAKEGFMCAPQGHTVVTFAYGEVVEGQVAEWALADRAASALLPERETKVEAPAETKRKRGRPRKKPEAE